LYDNSVEVYLQRSLIDKKLHFIPRNIPFQIEKEFKKNFLFYNSSPNYCELNLSVGSFGTKERLCNPNSRAVDGCDLLCCNRGYQSQIVTINNQCNCRFQWCCHVQCQNCITTHEISRCL
jgi:hypothetical protein